MSAATEKQGDLVLALRPQQAAAALGISPRTLWSLTQDGEIPCVRIGRAKLYPIALLQAWLERNTSTSGQKDSKNVDIDRESPSGVQPASAG